jgi:hypothetical protein
VSDIAVRVVADAAAADELLLSPESPPPQPTSNVAHNVAHNVVIAQNFIA